MCDRVSGWLLLLRNEADVSVSWLADYEMATTMITVAVTYKNKWQ